MNLKERLFLNVLAWRTRPSLLLRHLKSKKIQRRRDTAPVDRRAVRVAAAQLQLKLVEDVRDYVDEMARFASRAAQDGARLLVFPENNSFHLLGLIPGIEATAERLEQQEESAFRVADLFHALGPAFTRVAKTTFSALAQAYGLYIVAGSFPSPAGERVMNRAYVFGPDGMLLGVQDKVHLTPLEHAWGLSSGDKFHVFSTQLGNLAAPVCMDATYFETFRILANLGAEIVAVPIANPEDYNEWLALRGIWPRVQESLVFGVRSALVGRLFSYNLTGKAGIFAPLELTPEKNGVLAEAEHAGREGYVSSVLNLEALQELRASHPYLGDQNHTLRKTYFPALYQTNAH